MVSDRANPPIQACSAKLLMAAQSGRFVRLDTGHMAYGRQEAARQVEQYV